MGNLPVSCDVQVGYVMYPMDSGVVGVVGWRSTLHD